MTDKKGIDESFASFFDRVAGFKIELDNTVPDGTLLFRDQNGNIIGQMTGIDVSTNPAPVVEGESMVHDLEPKPVEPHHSLNERVAKMEAVNRELTRIMSDLSQKVGRCEGADTAFGLRLDSMRNELDGVDSNLGTHMHLPNGRTVFAFEDDYPELEDDDADTTSAEWERIGANIDAAIEASAQPTPTEPDECEHKSEWESCRLGLGCHCVWGKCPVDFTPRRAGTGGWVAPRDRCCGPRCRMGCRCAHNRRRVVTDAHRRGVDLHGQGRRQQGGGTRAGVAAGGPGGHGRGRGAGGKGLPVPLLGRAAIAAVEGVDGEQALSKRHRHHDRGADGCCGN